MRIPLLFLCAALVAAGALVAGRLTAPVRVVSSSPASSAGAMDSDQFGKRIHDYLVANPEVLIEAMKELERKQDSERDNLAQKGIEEHGRELMNDPDSPVSGNPNGDVTIVEFSDYQCPYCKRTYPALKSVVAADGKLKIVYKDLPILGEASRIAALAALAARNQNKHEALHNALMEFSGKLDRDQIMTIAASVGIDVAQLQKDMEDPKLKDIIDRNMALASALGVRGTPAFVIGKQFVPGAVDADALKQLIDEARKG
ncbi:Protein-disulfide isomerase [Enhydrobacter aerosaccus]|uniref:Protein-disulfide isomerase n=1 Tax=Enhydrobacter aerosaccus TaxID=225324 RepID=A0A1T4LQ14_9HYPH|nr:DsbA family protein [Enhydrobacter aerosaccus]SJZ56628.1 Protein-disulfide isomerase [Enhydrobacter aerosaccus]